MFRLARNASAAFMLTAGLIIAAPASAQIQLTPQEYYKLRTIAAEDTDGLRSLFRIIHELPPELEDMLLAFQQRQLRSRDAADYLYQRFGGRLDRRSDFSQRLDDDIIAQTEVLVDAVFRLPVEEQEQYLAFIRSAFDIVAETEPQICYDMATDNMTAVESARIDYLGYEAMGSAGLADLLALYEVALEAEFTGRAPATNFTDDELEAGENALATLARTLFEDSPAARRVGEAEDISDVSAEDLCAVVALTFDAIEILEQPERSWALRAVADGN